MHSIWLLLQPEAREDFFSFQKPTKTLVCVQREVMPTVVLLHVYALAIWHQQCWWFQIIMYFLFYQCINAISLQGLKCFTVSLISVVRCSKPARWKSDRWHLVKSVWSASIWSGNSNHVGCSRITQHSTVMVPLKQSDSQPHWCRLLVQALLMVTARQARMALCGWITMQFNVLPI